MLSKLKKISSLVLFFMLICLYQNCDQGFESSLQKDQTVNSTVSNNETTPSQLKDCGIFADQEFETRQMYAEASVQAGSSCQMGEQRRLCDQGQWSSWSIDFRFPTCITEGVTPPVPTGKNDLRMYIFGHSLLVHENTPFRTEEKKVPHWIKQLANQAGLNYAIDGQYGFLRNHADFSNIRPQWRFEHAPSVWTNRSDPFASVDYNVIISTPANFVQHQASSVPYYDSQTVSPLSATMSIFDQSRNAHPGIPFYIYENWPDMRRFGTFPDNVDFTGYNNETISGNFHQWFLSYHDSLLAARPGSDIKMIPVGPTLSKLFRDTTLSGLSINTLYEDGAPHGQPSLYFLASLVTYMAVYQTPAPADFSIPNTIDPLIRTNYSSIVNFIWNELQNFNHADGTSRVF